MEEALGASTSNTLALVLAQAFRMNAAGVAFGLAASFGLTRLLAVQLYSVKSSDQLTFIVVPVILVAFALAAACIPALRASRLDAIVALKERMSILMSERMTRIGEPRLVRLRGQAGGVLAATHDN